MLSCSRYKRTESEALSILIGSGGFANCFEFKSKDTGEVYALKVISNLDKKKALQEVSIHRELKHNNIVKFVGCFIQKKTLLVSGLTHLSELIQHSIFSYQHLS